MKELLLNCILVHISLDSLRWEFFCVCLFVLFYFISYSSSFFFLFSFCIIVSLPVFIWSSPLFFRLFFLGVRGALYMGWMDCMARMGGLSSFFRFSFSLLFMEGCFYSFTLHHFSFLLYVSSSVVEASSSCKEEKYLHTRYCRYGIGISFFQLLWVIS